MPTADPARLRGLVAANPPDDRRRVLAVRAEPVWSGPETIGIGTSTVRVTTARSPLAVRQAMAASAEHPDEVLVVLTACSGAELGLDVRYRLVHGDVVSLDPFASLRALFGARVLDPQLVEQRWLVDDLLDLAPEGGWPRRLGGVLDADHAWRVWEQARLGLKATPEGIAGLIALGNRPTLAGTLERMSVPARAALAARWGAGRSEPAGLLVDLLATGRGPDLVALGLVAGVLWAATDDPGLGAAQTVARARLEPLLGRHRLDYQAATAWSLAALEELDSRDPSRLDQREVAEQLLRDADATELAVLSEVLPAGFAARLARLGRAVSAVDIPAAQAACDALGAHRLAARRSHQVSAARAALRLTRRVRPMLPPGPLGQATLAASPADAAASLAGAVEEYLADGSWVQTTVRHLDDGAQDPEVAAAYAALGAVVAADAAGRQRRFAELLADWSRGEPPPDPRLVPVEALLATVAVPAATVAPLLVVVCDGMGPAVAHDLLDDLRQEGWAQIAPQGAPGWPAGVAALPTVTETSRTSLLCGRLVVGGQAQERDGFASHPELRAVSSPGRPPVLFHKAGLVGSAGTALSAEVQAAIADPAQRVVGVVVNSVDDHLARGDQVRVDWKLAALRPLGWLLDAAADAGRLVLLTADHGHVLDAGRSRYRPPPGDGSNRPVGGERWRVAPPAAGDDEVELSGPRVLLGGGRVILPTDDRLRYGGTKHGYHGGATPEEVVVPVAVLGRHLPDGWDYLPSTAPGWWTGQTPLPATRPLTREPLDAGPGPGGQERLFSPATMKAAVAGRAAAKPPASASWVDTLLANPAFVAQRARLPRPLGDDRLRRYLNALSGAGSSLDAVAAATGEPPDVARLALSALQRLVNIDGTEVLAVRADGAVELNHPLLGLQFGDSGRVVG